MSLQLDLFAEPVMSMPSTSPAPHVEIEPADPREDSLLTYPVPSNAARYAEILDAQFASLEQIGVVSPYRSAMVAEVRRAIRPQKPAENRTRRELLAKRDEAHRALLACEINSPEYMDALVDLAKAQRDLGGCHGRT